MITCDLAIKAYDYLRRVCKLLGCYGLLEPGYSSAISWTPGLVNMNM